MPRAGRGCGDTSSGRQAVSSAACHRGCSADGGILCARTRHRRGSALHHPAWGSRARLPEVRVAGPHRCWRDYDPPRAGYPRWARLRTRRAARPVPLFAHGRRKRVQEMPGEVYLLPELNAWVASRGESWGFGSRRVMGMRLPLFNLDVSSCPRSSRTSSVRFLPRWRYASRALDLQDARCDRPRPLQHLGSGGSWFLRAPFEAYTRLSCG